jgi:hypothetical protein
VECLSFCRGGLCISRFESLPAQPLVAPIPRISRSRLILGGSSDFSQRAHWFWSTRDLPCLGERDTEGGFQVKASSETEEPP